MHNGFIYMVRRNKSAIKILARANVSEKTNNPNPNLMIDDPIIAKGVSETINQNKLDWEAYAEPGTTEEIISRWNKSGVKFPVGKNHPVIKKEYGSTSVTKKHNLGNLPTGRTPKFN